MTRLQVLVKRILDLASSIFLLTLLGPVMMLVALAVRLTSPGQVLFRQLRLGKDGVPFTCYKFRTMYLGVPDLRNPDGSTFNAEDDPRVTRIGRFLRKTSLDELPQLINVLKGDMSLVGPRPDIVEALALYRDGDEKRLAAKPGITGWAAIHGRNTLCLDRRRALDIEYVENFSLLLDLQILLRTIPYVLLGEGVFVPQPPEEKSADVQN
jgi:undecaprenyl phosphate N,N'-diacetylbacillosamine 1-phosphate transferase